MNIVYNSNNSNSMSNCKLIICSCCYSFRNKIKILYKINICKISKKFKYPLTYQNNNNKIKVLLMNKLFNKIRLMLVNIMRISRINEAFFNFNIIIIINSG